MDEINKRARRALILAVVLSVGMLIGAGLARSANRVHTGVINEDTRICAFNEIGPDTVEIFEKYNSIINRLEEVGIEGLTPVERMIGAFLSGRDGDGGCGTVATDYRVVLFREDGDYILFSFDIGYGFEHRLYLTWKLSFIADTVL